MSPNIVISQLALPGFQSPADADFSTENPREIRIICALASGPCSREVLDKIAGSSNGPDAIAALRRKGLDIPCERTPCRDADGEIVFRGLYRFTDLDRERTAATWGRLC